MNSRTSLALAGAGLTAAAMIAVPVWAAGGAGRLMDVTTQVVVHMAGMPAMPPRTLHKKVCTPPAGFDPRPIIRAQSKGKCNITNYRRQGGDVSFDTVCAMPAGTMTGHSDFHSTGSGVTGTTHSKVSVSGREMTMESTYTGKQVGTCNYTPPKVSG